MWGINKNNMIYDVAKVCRHAILSVDVRICATVNRWVVLLPHSHTEGPRFDPQVWVLSMYSLHVLVVTLWVSSVSPKTCIH